MRLPRVATGCLVAPGSAVHPLLADGCLAQLQGWEGCNPETPKNPETLIPLTPPCWRVSAGWATARNRMR